MSETRQRTYDPMCETLANYALKNQPNATLQDQQELAQRIQDTIEDYLLKFKLFDSPLLQR